MRSDSTDPSVYTYQGRMVSDHWARLAVTYGGANEEFRAKGIETDDATAVDLHALDMLHIERRIARFP